MTFSDVVFWVFAVITVLPALLILVSARIVHMAFWLLASLAGFAGLYLQMGAGFLGFAQVVVYIGGILILFLFGLMLTQKRDVPVREKWGMGLALPGVVTGLMVMGGFIFVAVATPWQVHAPAAVEHNTPSIGVQLMSDYILPFEVVSVVLVAAMVGATYIARGREEDQEGDDSATSEKVTGA